jgi:8-oxo-dGTP pyrophosphatase MutT (NUDIX family)
MNESEFACAMREMWEETNIHEKDIVVVRGIEPLEEVFTGSNHVTYLHKYYIGSIAHDEAKGGEIDIQSAGITNEHIRREIGAIRWCSLEEGLALIRPENREKRQVLLRAHTLFQTYCPLLLGASPRWTKR